MAINLSTLSGSSLAGQIGATGIQGASGVGASGITGASGATGTHGASGVGATGVGVQGASGPQGVSGASGATGPQGATGIGATGIIQNWIVKTAEYTAVNRDLIVANTSSAAFTITLPASPSTGFSVSFADPVGIWESNNLTVSRNGSTIEGSASDLILDVNNVRVDLVYDGTTWQAFTNLGPQGASGATGSQGIQGASGSTGLTGATGAGIINAYWSVVGASGATGALYFVHNGVNKAVLDSAGNFSVVGDVIAFETIT
jgi:collagen type VII alpha